MSNETRVTLLTGCSRGIGLAIAHYLLKRNPIDKVFAVARSEGPLEELKNQYPGQVEYMAADVADLKVGDIAVRACLNKFGRLDSLILNHGVLAPVTRLENANPEEWRSAFDINFFSCISFVKAAIPSLRSVNGNIIITSSGASISGYETWGAYGSSKAAVNHLAMTIAAEEKDITTLAIRPGVVATDMQREIREVHVKNMSKRDGEKFMQLHAEGKLLAPEQPGHVIAKLALDAPKDLSGRFLSWDSAELAKYQQ